MMHQSILIPRLCFIPILLFVGSTYADYCTSADPNITMSSNTQEWGCSGPSTGGQQVTIYLPANDSSSDGSPTKRDIWDNSSWIPAGFSYQVSPYFKPAAVLRQCSGSVITTYDTKDANLNGRGQTVVSQRAESNCSANGPQDPIMLYSGLGNVVKIIKEDIFFPGGVIHITDGYVQLTPHRDRSDQKLTYLNHSDISPFQPFYQTHSLLFNPA
jgi:hypothetical protein